MKKTKREAFIALAHHEAGHAVIARVLGLGVDSVTIIPDLDNGTAGTCYSDNATVNFANVADIEKDVIVYLAGPYAECQYRSLDFRNKAAGWSGDLETVAALIETTVDVVRSERCAKLFDQLCVETEILVNEHWSAIERVAQGLLDRSVLNGAEVDDLIGQVFESADEQLIDEAIMSASENGVGRTEEM